MIFRACIGPTIFVGQLVSLQVSSQREDLQPSPAPPDELDRTLTHLAGPKAIDCGHLSLGSCFPPFASDFKESDSCAASAFHSKKASRSRCDHFAWGAQSSLTSEGMVLTPQGTMCFLTFSSSDLPASFVGKISKHLALYKLKHPWVRTMYGRQLIREHAPPSPKQKSSKVRTAERSSLLPQTSPRKAPNLASAKE